MPNHMPEAGHGRPVDRLDEEGEPEKCPGAIRAIAFMVSPVRPSVALDGEDAVVFSDAIVAHLLLSVNLSSCF